MNANPLGWLCLTIAMGCLFVAMVAETVYRLMDADRRFWFRTVSARSFIAAIAFIGISIPT